LNNIRNLRTSFLKLY